jgi:D-glycero-D-manno-heptose 1,7-bisphosphate phosphatase
MSSQVKAARCVFLDRDGVINQGMNINRPEDFKLIPGVIDAIARLKQAGYLVILASNQGGLGEDLDGSIRWKNRPMTREQLTAVHAEMAKLLGDSAALDAVKFCPHSKSVPCQCKKPNPGMLVEASREFGIDLTQSYMVGDRATDVAAGNAAGVTAILVLSGPDGPDTQDKHQVPQGTLQFPSLVEAADWILSQP